MPVFEQGYRRYVGEKSTRSRAPAIAWENVRPRMRPLAWVLLLVLLLPYFIYGILLFVAAMFGTGSMPPIPPSTVAFEHTRGPNPAMVLGLVQNNRLGFFWELLDKASFASVIFPAILGTGLLASDRRTGALQIYFARPVTRTDYLAGKVMAIAFFVSLTTLVPCLGLWVETVLFNSASSLNFTTAVAPLAIFAASAFYMLWTAGLVLALSAVIKRPVFVGILAIFIKLLAEGVGALLAETMNEDAWHVLRPSVAVGSLTAPILGMDLPRWINGYAAFGLGFGLPVALLAFVWWRVRAVEVVT